MGFEDFDQMDTWDAGKTAGGRHGSMPSKKRMKNLTDKVNGVKSQYDRLADKSNRLYDKAQRLEEKGKTKRAERVDARSEKAMNKSKASRYEKIDTRTYEKGGKHEYQPYGHGGEISKDVRYKKGLKLQAKGKGKLSSYRVKKK